MGNYNLREFQGMLNVPISDKVAAKVSVSKTDRDGYIDNITTGNELDTKDVLAYRAQLRIQPTDQFEINLAYDGLSADNKILVGEPLTDPYGVMITPFAPKPRQVAFDFDPTEKRDVSGAMMDLNYEFANGFTVKSITGYRNTDAPTAMRQTMRRSPLSSSITAMTSNSSPRSFRSSRHPMARSPTWVAFTITNKTQTPYAM